MRQFINIIENKSEPTIKEILDEVYDYVTADLGAEDDDLKAAAEMVDNLRKNIFNILPSKIPDHLQAIEDRLTDWLNDNVQDVFEEYPEIDNARSIVQDLQDTLIHDGPRYRS